MALNIDFGESDFAPEETPKAAGGTYAEVVIFSY